MVGGCLSGCQENKEKEREKLLSEDSLWRSKGHASDAAGTEDRLSL